MGLGGLNRQLTSEWTRELQNRLNDNRERHFHATNRSEKIRHRDTDKALRRQLADSLTDAGLDAEHAARVARWDPYDQNANADWFDPEYMFGATDGFDIVIGNPPYRQVRKGIYSAAQFPYSEGRDKGKQNLYKLFVEQSYNLCKNNGLATMIVQSSLIGDLSSTWTRRLLLEQTQLRHVIEFPKAAPTKEAQLFQSVTQGTCIYQFTKSQPDSQPIKISVDNNVHTIADLRFAPITRAAIENLYPSLRCLPPIGQGNVGILERIGDDDTINPMWVYVSSFAQGDLNLTTHSNRFSNNPTKVRLIRGCNVGRFIIKWDTVTEYCDDGFKSEQVKANRNESFLVSQQTTGTNDVRRLHFALTDAPPADFLCGNSLNKLQLKRPAHSKAFLALLNSKFMDWFFRITSTNNHVQGYELEQLPIPAMTDVNRRQLGRLVDRILTAKAADPAADTGEAEAEIDRLVYGLYGLTEEIAVVSGGSANATGQPTREKPRFELVPLVSGYAPGVNDENLKDVICGQEDHDFLEKLNQ